MYGVLKATCYIIRTQKKLLELKELRSSFLVRFYQDRLGWKYQVLLKRKRALIWNSDLFLTRAFGKCKMFPFLKENPHVLTLTFIL